MVCAARGAVTSGTGAITTEGTFPTGAGAGVGTDGASPRGVTTGAVFPDCARAVLPSNTASNIANDSANRGTRATSLDLSLRNIIPGSYNRVHTIVFTQSYVRNLERSLPLSCCQF